MDTAMGPAPAPEDYCAEFGHTGGESDCPTHCADCGAPLRENQD